MSASLLRSFSSHFLVRFGRIFSFLFDVLFSMYCHTSKCILSCLYSAYCHTFPLISFILLHTFYCVLSYFGILFCSTFYRAFCHTFKCVLSHFSINFLHTSSYFLMPIVIFWHSFLSYFFYIAFLLYFSACIIILFSVISSHFAFVSILLLCQNASECVGGTIDRFVILLHSLPAYFFCALRHAVYCSLSFLLVCMAVLLVHSVILFCAFRRTFCCLVSYFFARLCHFSVHFPHTF